MLLTWCEIVPFSCPMTTVPTNFPVPLMFSRSHKGSAPGHSPSQFYDVTPYRPSGGTQAQALLRDRLVASPRIDLNDYSAKEVIDWVELKATTSGYHQAINMQRRLAEILKDGGEDSSIFVGGPDRGKGHKGHQFILRIQQPTRRGLALVSRDLVRHYEVGVLLPRDLLLAGIEVSVDFYPKPGPGLSDDDLDKESPESMKQYAPTTGHVFELLGSHWMMHCGQWVIVRRQLGKAPLF